MEHSTAILEDANKTIEAAASQTTDAQQDGSKPSRKPRDMDSNKVHTNNHDRRRGKRKHEGDDSRQGSRGGRNDNKRHKKGDLGRADY